MLPTDTISEEWLTNYLVQGLKPETRKDVRLHSPKTLLQATELAEKIEHCLSSPISLNYGGDAESDSPDYPVDADGNTIMAIRASTRYRRSSHSPSYHRGNNTFRRGRSSYSSSSPAITSSTNHDRDDIRHLCVEYNLCFKCRRAGHRSNRCPNASKFY